MRLTLFENAATLFRFASAANTLWHGDKTPQAITAANNKPIAFFIYFFPFVKSPFAKHASENDSII